VKLLGREIGLHQPFFLIAGPCVVESQSSGFEEMEL
jgi:3-deoxy-D-manno-octulosonic acid (KDO) 8-phosphate synthase